MSVRGVPRYVGESDLAYHDRVVDLFARMAKLHVVIAIRGRRPTHGKRELSLL